MPPTAWVAAGTLVLGLIVQLVIFVRFITKLENKIEMQGQRTNYELKELSMRIEAVERKVDAGKVVMLRGTRSVER